jgi:hypothetical protein
MEGGPGGRTAGPVWAFARKQGKTEKSFLKTGSAPLFQTEEQSHT